MKNLNFLFTPLVFIAFSFLFSTTVNAQTAVTCTNDIFESFNGTKLNDEIWTYKAEGNKVSNILTEWAKKDGNTSGASYLRAKNFYTGDFEASVDILSFDAITSSSTDGAAVRIQVFKQGGGESVDAFAMTWRKRVEGSTLAGHIHRNKVFEETSSKEVDAFKPITIKVIRTGSTAEFYYKNVEDTEYTLVSKAENITIEPVTIGVSVIITAGNASGISATYDNFYIGCKKAAINPVVQTVEVPVEKIVNITTNVIPSYVYVIGGVGAVIFIVIGGLVGFLLSSRKSPGNNKKEDANMNLSVQPLNTPVQPVVVTQPVQPLVEPEAPAPVSNVSAPTPGNPVM